MRKDKVRAYELRRLNKSYSEVSKTLGIPKSTIASWFKNEEWSQTIKKELGATASLAFPKKLAAIQKANKTRWANIHQKYRDAAEIEFASLKDVPLFLAGLMLYWGEGDKSERTTRVKLSNADPIMIRVFYKVLKDIIKIPPAKIYVWLLLYPDLVDNMQKTFWSRATGIPISQFKKSICMKVARPPKRLSYGVCNIYVSSRELKEKMMTWLALYQRLLI